jgi:4-amino-4-deoxy-L-arabinose transferase-like glycosyltransferase
MPAVAFSGETIDWFAVKATIILIGLGGVVAAWCLVRRVSGRAVPVDLAALVVALNPFFWDFSHQAMTEVPTITWIFAALLLGDLTFARRKPSGRASFLVGFVSGLGMLIKGNVLGLALLPAAYFFGPRQMNLGWRGKSIMACLFGIGFVLPFSIWTVRNSTVDTTGFDSTNLVRMIFQRDKMNPESERIPFAEMVEHVSKNLRWHSIYHVPEQIIPGLWLHSARNYRGGWWFAASLCLLLLAVSIPWRWQSDYLGFDLVLLPMTALYLLFSEGGAARYWVPVSVVLSVLIATRLEARAAFRKVVNAPWVLGITVVVLGMNLGAYVMKHERQPYNPDGPWKELVELFDIVAKRQLETQGVLTPHMYTFQLMTAYPAPMASAYHNPLYDYMIVRLDRKELQPPQGAVLRVKVFPWGLYQLPGPKTRMELLGECDFSEGIPIWMPKIRR